MISDKRVVKIVPCFPYTSKRGKAATNSPTSYHEWEANIKDLIDAEINVNPGCKMDVILYLRIEPGRDIETNRARAFLSNYDEIKIANGILYVVETSNDQTYGFGILKDLLTSKYVINYTHFIYQEDDIYILKDGTDNYVLDALELNKPIVPFITYGRVGTFIRQWSESDTLHINGCFALYEINDTMKNTVSEWLANNRLQTNELQASKFLLRSLNITEENQFGILTKYKNWPINVELSSGFKNSYLLSSRNLDGKTFLFGIGQNYKK